MSDETTKAAVKEAVKEWLNEQMSSLGWFSMKALLAMFVSGIVWLALVSNGWHK